MSDEGVLLFVRHLTMSVEDWVKLSALVSELGQLRSVLTSMSSTASGKRVPQLAIAAGWLHRRRRKLLKLISVSYTHLTLPTNREV